MHDLTQVFDASRPVFFSFQGPATLVTGLVVAEEFSTGRSLGEVCSLVTIDWSFHWWLIMFILVSVLRAWLSWFLFGGERYGKLWVNVQQIWGNICQWQWLRNRWRLEVSTTKKALICKASVKWCAPNIWPPKCDQGSCPEFPLVSWLIQGLETSPTDPTGNRLVDDSWYPLVI